jgi:membrane fusion protein
MSHGLFRKEVFAAQRDEWLGAIRVRAPRLGWIFLSIGIATVAIILALLFGGHYTRYQPVTGSLVPTGGLISLSSTSPGVIARLYVREGDTVRAGQALVEVSSVQTSASLGDTQAAVLEQLKIKQSRLNADLGEQERLRILQQHDLRTRLATLNEQIAQTEQQVDVQKQRADSAMVLYERWSKVGESGIVSKVQVLQQHDLALQGIAELKELKGRVLQAKQEAEQIQGQLSQIPAVSASRRNETERELADVRQVIAQNAAQSAVLMKAATDGVVTNVLVHQGQAVTAQQTLLTVLPKDSLLQAELWVPTQAIGFIHAGQTVMIRYRAYPYQKFGQYVGSVERVSRSAMQQDDVKRLSGQSIDEPRYRVQVRLKRQKILVYGKDESLKPGMMLDAHVLLDRRRLVEWAFEPLYGIAKTQGEPLPSQEEGF